MIAILAYLAVFAAGLVVLYFGAEGLLKGAVSIARRFGVSPLVIGLTLVAFGTSAPELSLDVTAAIRGNTQLAFGDLVGSNIANLGLILGVAALIRPLDVHMRLLRAEVPIAIAVSLLLWGMADDQTLSRGDGLTLLAIFVLFLTYSYAAARQESPAVKEEFVEAAEEQQVSVAWAGVLVVGGLIGLVLGAQAMVFGAVEIAKLAGVSEMMIGLTIVAIGTSLPELATAIVAARKNEADIVVGNVIGSNAFNILLILALVAVIRPIEGIRPETLRFDLPVMAALTIALLPLMIRGKKVTRVAGAFLLTCYVGFLGWQIVSAWQPSPSAAP